MLPFHGLPKPFRRHVGSESEQCRPGCGWGECDARLEAWATVPRCKRFALDSHEICGTAALHLYCWHYEQASDDRANDRKCAVQRAAGWGSVSPLSFDIALARTFSGQVSSFFSEIPVAQQTEFAAEFGISLATLKAFAAQFGEWSGQSYQLAA